VAAPLLEYRGYEYSEEELRTAVPQLGASPLDVKAGDWEANLKELRDYISRALDAVFEDKETWRSIMEARAVPAYSSFVNPQWPRAAKALLKYRVKLVTAYEKWKANKDRAYGEGGRFEQGVSAGVDAWKRMVVPVLKIVGVRPLGLGPIAKAFRLLMGLPAPIDTAEIAPGVPRDSMSGKPVQVAYDPDIAFTVYAIIPKAVEAAVYSHYYREAGMAEEADKHLESVSGKVTEFLNRLKRPDIGDITFKLAYDGNIGRHYVYVRVEPPAT